MSEPNEELLEANEAVKYLARRWGIESYSLEAFRMLRFRNPDIKPALSSRTSSFWRKSDLDLIPKPDRSKPRPLRRVKKTGVSGETDGSKRTVMLMESRLLGSVA